MKQLPSDQEIDEFFDWLQIQIPPLATITVPEPSEELLEMAVQAVKSQRDYLFDNRLYQETLWFKAAADDNTGNLPFQLNNIGGEWSITRETIPGDNAYQMLKFRCFEQYQPIYERRHIKALIGNHPPFDLGEVFDCVAEAIIPSELDLNKERITICIEELVDDSED